MCGIAGFIDNSGLIGTDRHAIAKRMIAKLHHRGPDSSGVWCDESCVVFLAHARLAIIDLSPAGHQPMISASGRLVLVFNGEIYNFKAIRKQLEQEGSAPKWHGTSDTEVLLAAFEAWGVERTLKSTVGMFALALWDKEGKTLYLARDRMGEKPLYYGCQKDLFLFASELKAIKTHPDFHPSVDRHALTLYLRHNYIPAPFSIYQDVKKLEPGCFLRVRCNALGNFRPTVTPYWSLKDVVYRGIQNPFPGTEKEAVDELQRLLAQAVMGQMVADVPLGAFLSGGYDSTTVVATMQAHSNRPVETFTIGFHEKAYNEADHAKTVASHLGTNHHELYLSPQDALQVIPDLPTIWDEPFSDSSQIPTYLVSKFARTKVTVSLSGDGGDELFFGYQRYFKGLQGWNLLKKFPLWVRKVVAFGLENVPGRFLEVGQHLLPNRHRFEHLADRLPKLAEVVRMDSAEAFYRCLISHAKFPEDWVKKGKEPETIFETPDKRPPFHDFASYMMYMDAVTYLPDDILVKVDRATMAVSLETRVPLLDHRLVEFAWSLPLSMKYRNGQGKWLLRQVLYRHVPQGIMDRPKMGFGVPIEHWLRGPLRDWAEELLDESRLKRDGFFKPEPIRRMWYEHKTGRRRWHYYLWDILMFQAWLEKEERNS